MIDFFCFPISEENENKLFCMDEIEIKAQIELLEDGVISHSMVALFDQDVVVREKQARNLNELTNIGKFSFAYLPPLENGEFYIDKAIDAGCKSIVFHPYLQKITDDKLFRVSELSTYAASKDMLICVCCAYGSKDIYTYYPLKSAIAAAEKVKSPVVIIHGGGEKVLEAFLIAEAFPHVYMETSFSLHYWMGSNVSSDFAFAMRKLGSERWLFGSDHPFVNRDVAINCHLDFLEKNKFSEVEIDNIMHNSAAELLGQS